MKRMVEEFGWTVSGSLDSIGKGSKLVESPSKLVFDRVGSGSVVSSVFFLFFFPSCLFSCFLYFLPFFSSFLFSFYLFFLSFSSLLSLFIFFFF